MLRASFLLSFFLLPMMASGQRTLPIASSSGGRGQASAAPAQPSPSPGQASPQASQATGQPTPSPSPTPTPMPPPPHPAGAKLITLDEAINLALLNNPALRATRTTVQQSQA